MKSAIPKKANTICTQKSHNNNNICKLGHIYLLNNLKGKQQSPTKYIQKPTSKA